MITLITILHIFLCLILIIIVLLQTGKGADIGAAFGGASQTIFGPRGAATFLSKVTTISAILFMITTIFLAYFSGRSERLGGSIMDKAKVEEMEKEMDRATGAGEELTPEGEDGGDAGESGSGEAREGGRDAGSNGGGPAGAGEEKGGGTP